MQEKNLGYNVTSLDAESGQLRLIQVKGLSAATGTILLTPSEQRVVEDRCDCCCLYVVTNCAAEPQLQKLIEDTPRLPSHEVTNVQHYRVEVDGMTRSMQLREEQAKCGDTAEEPHPH